MNLKINDRLRIRDVEFFNDFKLDLKYDSVASTFSFKYYFDPFNKEHAELACVSHFHEAILEHNGERLITGYILSNIFNDSSKKQLSEIGGYSKPGVLEDCEIPTSLYPLEVNGLTLKEITQKIIKPFGLGLIVDADTNEEVSLAFTDVAPPDVDGGIIQSESGIESVSQTLGLPDKLNKKIDKANAREIQNIKSFLTELATQRNVLLSHDSYGNLLFTEAKTNLKPILYFNVPENGLIGTSMSLSFNGQGMHSHITVLKQASPDEGNAGEFTIRNPYVPILYRPRVITQTSGDDITIEETARQALAAELKNITLTITTDRWEIDGKIIRPNNIISVYNPDLFIYSKTNFFIESVSFTGDAKKTTAVLTCVLPEVYNKKVVKNIFVNAHENFPRI